MDECHPHLIGPFARQRYHESSTATSCRMASGVTDRGRASRLATSAVAKRTGALQSRIGFSPDRKQLSRWLLTEVNERAAVRSLGTAGSRRRSAMGIELVAITNNATMGAYRGAEHEDKGPSVRRMERTADLVPLPIASVPRSKIRARSKSRETRNRKNRRAGRAEMPPSGQGIPMNLLPHRQPSAVRARIGR